MTNMPSRTSARDRPDTILTAVISPPERETIAGGTGKETLRVYFYFHYRLLAHDRETYEKSIRKLLLFRRLKHEE